MCFNFYILKFKKNLFIKISLIFEKTFSFLITCNTADHCCYLIIKTFRNHKTIVFMYETKDKCIIIQFRKMLFRNSCSKTTARKIKNSLKKNHNGKKKS